MPSSGLPTGLELEILETVRNEVPPEVFTTEYKNPVNGNPEAVRNNLREATRLLREAGWEIKNQKLVNAKTGEPMEAEFLLDEPIFERFVLFYKPSLERLGIAVTVRTVDDSQYENRTRAFDFDIVVGSWRQSLSPGNEQRGDWGSRAADRPGSRNLVGIKNAAVDKLIDRVVFAKSREELVAATRALDRVLLWNHYVVPQWTYRKVRTAYWDRYSPSGEHAGIRRRRLPDHLVVGRGKGGQDRRAAVMGNGDGLTRRKVLVLSAGAATAGAFARAPAFAAEAPRRPMASRSTAFPASATSNIPATFAISITSIRKPRRAACSRRSARAASTIRTS